jgi:UDPglucose--hexose-1-phosphate uridylyltransferase
MSKFIFDELTQTPTILATSRAKRTDQTGAVSTLAGGPKTDKPKVCFFCPGSEHLTPPTLYEDTDPWNVRVFANKFPLLENHEVVVHSREHEKDIEDLDHDQNVRIIRAYLDRVSFYGTKDKEVIIFNNRGGRAGASIMHPHSQIVAAKGFPGIVEQEKESALHYYNAHSRCYWCDEIKKAQQEDRVVFESKYFVVMIPAACRWSYEMKLIPKNHKPNFGFIDEKEIHDLADVLKASLRAYNALFNRPDRNFWIHTMRYEPFHWHMGFIPHIKVFGALELGAGIWVSDKATPQDAATQLRYSGVFDFEAP